MTGLLVSVRNAAEARLALAAGVDLIDVKEPLSGPLGSADAESIRQVVAAVEASTAETRDTSPLDGSIAAPCVSVALGELMDFADLEGRICAGVGFAKLGLAGCEQVDDWRDRWACALAGWPAHVGPVAVVYADRQRARSPRSADIVAAAQALGCQAVLCDTFDKRAGGLLDCWTLAELQGLIEAVKLAGMLAVVGGGLTQVDLPAVVRLTPDYVAVRGAACAGDRTGQLCPRKLAVLVQLVRSAAQPLGSTVSLSAR